MVGKIKEDLSPFYQMDKKLKIGIVVPTYKVELWNKFVKAWDWNSDEYDLVTYIIEDNPDWSTEMIYTKGKSNHLCWKDIDDVLGDKSWIIPRRCSAIRSYGYLKAYQDGMDYILTLDDDCYPIVDDKMETLITRHIIALEDKHEYSSFYNVGAKITNTNLWMRGSPIRYRKPRSPVVSVGGWSNNPDLDAWTQMENQEPKSVAIGCMENVPKNLGVTMCGMNVMFSREVIPASYFLLNGEQWGVYRTDDIWAGLFLKKVLDTLDLPMCINGYASVKHERASDPFDSLQKEGLSLLESELLWDRILPLDIKSKSLEMSYASLAAQLDHKWFPEGSGDYGNKLKKAMLEWVNLFNEVKK